MTQINSSNTRKMKQNLRTVSPNNSISTSIEESDTDQDQSNHKQQSRFESAHWLVLVPVIGTTIMMWAQKANARVRQHATACCTGDFCVGTDTAGPTIPEEIFFQKCTSKTDIELTTFEASSIVGDDVYAVAHSHPCDIDSGYDTSWTVPHPIRRTKWNEIPDDPVDEVSLKGSSMYLSDGEDDVKALPYKCDDDDDDDYHSDIRKLQHQWDKMKKM